MSDGTMTKINIVMFSLSTSVCNETHRYDVVTMS